MTLLFGCINANEDLFTKEKLESLKPSKEYTNSKIIKYKNVTLGAMWTDTFEKDMRIIETEEAIIIINGYISNEEDLKHTIEEYYKLFGIKFIDKLEGAYQTIIYNKQTNTIYMSISPYCCWQMMHGNLNEGFYFSNYFPAFKKIFPKPFTKNYKKFAERLLFIITNAKDSFFNEMQCIPSGHILKYGRGKTMLKQYWNINKLKKQKISNLDDLIKSLKAITTKNISNIINHYGSVGTDLSGGLDSAYITGITAEIYRINNRTLNTYSIATPGIATLEEENMSNDDSELIFSMKDIHDNLVFNIINPANKTYSFEQNTNFCIDNTGFTEYTPCILMPQIERFKQAKFKDDNVILNGCIGDLSFSWPGETSPKAKLRKLAKKILKLRKKDLNIDFYYLLNKSKVRRIAKNKSNDLKINMPTQRKALNDLLNGYTDSIKLSSFCQIKYNLRYIDGFVNDEFLSFITSIPRSFYRNKSGNRLVARESLKTLAPKKLRINTNSDCINAAWFLQMSEQYYNFYYRKIPEYKSNNELKKFFNFEKLESLFQSTININQRSTIRTNLLRYNLLRALHICDFIDRS